MHKIALSLLILAFFVLGCAYNKQTLLKVNGEEVRVPLGPFEEISGTGLRATLYRNVSIAYGKKEAIAEFTDIKSDDKAENGTHSESIDVK